MLKSENILTAVNRATKPFLLISGESISLNQHVRGCYRLKLLNQISTAYNNYGNHGELVNVVKWFHNFWLFIEIQLLNPTGVIVSLSIFQGEDNDSYKTQLFRAEWDDYDSGSISHPQPHWHFLTNRLIERNAKEFTELLGKEKETFEEFLNQEINKVIDLSKFHFAMNGDWANSNLHTHSINSEISLANWLGGLLGYLKSELEYMQKKHP